MKLSLNITISVTLPCLLAKLVIVSQNSIVCSNKRIQVRGDANLWRRKGIKLMIPLQDDTWRNTKTEA